MPDNLYRFALFENPSHLLSALHMLIPGHQQYPDQLFFAQERGWAINRDVLGDEHDLTKLAAQHSWIVEFPKKLEGCWLPTPAILDGKWSYCDPLQFGEWGSHTAHPLSEDSAWAWLGPHVPHHEFLLGAKDQEGARRILEVIHAHHTEGIRFVPILAEPHSDEKCPFRYFWSIFTKGPKPILLDEVDRVWWGPVGYGRVQIFLEYPWSLPVPIHVLHRIPWAPDIGLVLLSKNEPRVVEIRLAANGKLFTDYPGVVELTTTKDQVSEPIVASQSKSNVSFKLAIRLGGPDPHAAGRKRIEQLRGEIYSKQHLLELMERRQDQREPDDFSAEPLFLYGQTPYERGRIPLEIQRLLLEWTDQPEDLEAISYAFLPAETIPKGLFIEGSCVHIIAPNTALGRSGTFATGPRLLDFAPKTSNSSHLTLDPDWGAQGFRLFTPANDHVWLYPNLRPSRSSARCFASAIHATAGTRFEEWIYLLLPDVHTQFRFILLPINAFRPLSKAFEWVLDIDVGIDLPKVAQSVRGKICAVVCEAIDDNLSEAVQKEATARLDKTVVQLKGEVTELETALKMRAELIQTFSSESKGLDNQVTNINKSFDELLTIDQGLQNLAKNFHADDDQLESLSAFIDQIRKTRQSIDKLVRNVDAIRVRWIQSKKNG